MRNKEIILEALNDYLRWFENGNEGEEEKAKEIREAINEINGVSISIQICNVNEFNCQDCGESTEFIARHGESSKELCPHCSCEEVVNAL